MSSDDEITRLSGEEIAAFRKLLVQATSYEPRNGDSPLDAVEELIDRLDKLDKTARKAERQAASAIGVAQQEQRADGASPTKIETARTLSRNELVRRALLGNGTTAQQVTVGQVQDMARPSTNLYHQTISDAWADLEATWSCFETGENEAGLRVLRVNASALTEELVGVVELDLDRDDLIKRLLNRKTSPAGETR